MKEKNPIRELSPSAASVILLAVTLLMFGSVLFSSGDTVVSREGTDLSRQFIYWRDFGFHELKQGNLPLWNPHLFSGVPFLGGFQSALLYPLNLVYVILPLAKAIDVSVALHVFLIGFFTYLWMAYHGLHPLARLTSAVLVMFSGAHFLHIFAGHLPNLCTMAWTPLLLLSIDGLFRKPGLPWCLLGVFALAMQILAGHPQYVYYTMLTVILYVILGLYSSRHRMHVVLGIAGICIGAVSLTAVQIASGVDASRESIRSIGVSEQFAAMFSFPPENLVTLFAPYFFGDMTHLPYWGRGYLWESCLFFGATGLALAIFGAFHGNRGLRLSCAVCAGVLVILALGAHTPLFFVLYRLGPGYAFFRGSAKLIFFATLFLAALAGIGLDHMIKNGQSKKVFSAVTASAGVFIGAAAVYLFLQPFQSHFSTPWRQLIETIAASRESYLPPSTFTDLSFVHEAATFAAKGLLLASATFLLLSLLLLIRRISPPKATCLIALLAFVEVFVFARMARPTFDLHRAMAPGLAAFYASRPGDYRILNTINPNSAMSLHAQDIWGYDPGISLRYARFIAFTQGYDPEQVTQYIQFRRYHRLYSMLRCRFVIVPDGASTQIYETPDVLPRLLLVKDWRLITGCRGIFEEMEKPDFDPRNTVILEDVPDPQPGHSPQMGSCLIADSTTDHLTIRANLPEPAILLITDSYSRGWQARALDGSTQRDYRIMPANYTLMALPLSAGAHHLRLEYEPLAFVVGKWISLFSVIAYMLLIALCIRKKLRRGTAYETESHQGH